MHTQEDILKRLNILNAKLQEGDLNQLELEELVQLSREFHEKCLILRYKAIEQQVYAESKIEEEIIVPDEPEVIEKEEVEEEKGMMSFDFSSPADESSKPETTNIAKETEKLEEKVEEEEVTPEPVKKEITKVTITQPEPINTLNNPVQNQGSFYDRFNKDDNSLASKLGASKIVSLKEAFGLNERLQCINELFGGSKDQFENSLNKLESSDSLNHAKQKLIDLGVELEWDMQSDLVNDLISKVERRYA